MALPFRFIFANLSTPCSVVCFVSEEDFSPSDSCHTRPSHCEANLDWEGPPGSPPNARLERRARGLLACEMSPPATPGLFQGLIPWLPPSRTQGPPPLPDAPPLTSTCLGFEGGPSPVLTEWRPVATTAQFSPWCLCTLLRRTEVWTFHGRMDLPLSVVCTRPSYCTVNRYF